MWVGHIQSVKGWNRTNIWPIWTRGNFQQKALGFPKQLGSSWLPSRQPPDSAATLPGICCLPASVGSWTSQDFTITRASSLKYIYVLFTHTHTHTLYWFHFSTEQKIKVRLLSNTKIQIWFKDSEVRRQNRQGAPSHLPRSPSLLTCIATTWQWTYSPLGRLLFSSSRIFLKSDINSGRPLLETPRTQPSPYKFFLTPLSHAREVFSQTSLGSMAMPPWQKYSITSRWPFSET